MHFQMQSTSTLLVQISLQLLQLEGFSRSSILTLLCYQLVERVMNTFLIHRTPDRETCGHEDGHKDRKECNTGSESLEKLDPPRVLRELQINPDDLLTQAPVLSWGETATK